MACFVAFLLRLHLCHDIVKLGGFFLSGCFIQVLHVRDDFNSSVSKTVSWWVGRWVGTWASHDDVIKWKHFPRYWPFERESPGHRWFPSQSPVTRSFDVFFDLRLNKLSSKQSRRRWFETPLRSLSRHCDGGWWPGFWFTLGICQHSSLHHNINWYTAPLCNMDVSTQTQ